MKEKWLPVALVAGALFAVNVAGRLVGKFWAGDNDDRTIKVGIVAYGLIGLITMLAAVRWVRQYPAPRVWGDLGFAIGLSCLASVLLGPLIVGISPFEEGAGMFFRQIWVYLGVAIGSGIFGALVVMTLGRDWKSQAWKRYAEQSRTRPRRTVRR
jgi:hypothetical protein